MVDHYDEKNIGISVNASLSHDDASSQKDSINEDYYVHHHTHRTLNSRHVQLIAIGGSIGTAIFITIGNGLATAGPGSLFIAFVLWSLVIWAVSACAGEMVCYLPVDSPFIQMAGRCVDPAFEATVAFNFYLTNLMYIPFEITAVNSMIHYWRDDYSPAITFCIQIFLYGMLNLFAVKYYGESEFWLSIGKFILMIGLLFFTFIMMVGGNPDHHAFGFQYWKNPGAFGELYTTGSTGKMHGFLSALIKAGFVVVGPEYLSIMAGEARNPRKVVAKAFKTLIARLMVFYVGGALSVGILCAYNDPRLVAGGNVSSSPYVIAMNNFGIKGLPDLVNGVIVTSAFSAGNSYVYCSSRALYSLAQRGYFFKKFAYTSKAGVPIYCVAVSIAASCLSLLQLGSGSATVLNWLVNICTGAMVLNYSFMCISYLFFYRAVKAQGIDRDTFSYKGWLQPYTSIFGLVFTLMMVGIVGYPTFLPGQWSPTNFIIYYVMIFIDLAIYIGFKLVMRTKVKKPEEADLTTGLSEIEAHEADYYAKLNTGEIPPPKWYTKVLDVLL